ncbi:MAG: RnfABCDGE type electron transport complex subunit B [Suipraeoptans sp.]
MSISGVLIALAIVGATGLFIGLFLGLAGKKFAVEVDPKEAEVLEALPGNNCGACGFPGCSGLAAAIAKGDADIAACPVGGQPVADVIAGIMGVEAEATEKEVAFVKCEGNCEIANQNYDYYGIQDCVMINMMQDGGPKMCNYGCLGAGSCVKACEFDAITIKDGIAVIDKDKCKTCKKCIAICPKNLIELIPYSQGHRVLCNSRDKGKGVITACKSGCIACKMCEKVCEFDAIHVEDNIAHIDYEKCTNCGACAQKCPKKCIVCE